jgi:lysophospholipase L1-like esterase
LFVFPRPMVVRFYHSIVSRIIALACALACALGTLAMAPAAHADGAGPVRILILGDSLSLGRHGMYTWRYRLDKEFHRQGVPFDFVGSLSSTFVDKGYPAPHYADPNFDQNHLCKAGWWLRDAIGGELGAEVAAQNPDVVVFELGGADLTYGDSPEVTTTRLRSAIAEMRAAKPDIRIIVPKTTTKDRPDPSVNERTNRFNAGLPQVVADLSTPESPITVADTMRGWAPNAIYTTEGSHLSPTGEAFYAQRIAEEMHADGILPQTPQVFHGYIPWKRTVPLKVRATAGHIEASWSRQTVTSGQVRWRPSGTSTWRNSAKYTGGKVTWAVPTGHTYDVQLLIRWYGLTGPFGATYRVAVPRLARPATPARVIIGPGRVSWSASVGATSYVVRFRKTHGHRWIRRHTQHALSIRAAHVSVAEVRAVDAAGSSGWHVAHRTAVS